MSDRVGGYNWAQKTCRDMDDRQLAACLEALARTVVRHDEPDYEIRAFAVGQLEGVLELIENRRQHFMAHTAADRIPS